MVQQAQNLPEIKVEDPIDVPDVTMKFRFYSHRVRWPDESLSLISKWYTGNEKNQNALAMEEPIIHPGHVLIGDVILIPNELMITPKPMPRNFIHATQQRKKIKQVISRKKSKPYSPKLFGPIESAATHPTANDVELFPPIDMETTSQKFNDVDLFPLIE
ncbi:MAG: hypothetical protein KKD44_03485 [Proteobacteria bacterium]|nr:hypothetical protein [Pseudomonadota bacterium]